MTVASNMRLFADEPSGSNILQLWVIFEGLTMVVVWSKDIQIHNEWEIVGNLETPESQRRRDIALDNTYLPLQPQLYPNPQMILPYQQPQWSGLSYAQMQNPNNNNGATRASPRFQQLFQTVLQQVATLQPPRTYYGSTFQPEQNLYISGNQWMYPMHQTQQWVQPPYQVRQPQQWVQPQYIAQQSWYPSFPQGPYIQPNIQHNSQPQTDDFEKLYQDPENAFRLAQNLMNKLDSLIETIRPIKSTLEDNVRFSLFQLAAQLLSRIASVSVALISQRNNSDMDKRVDNFLHNAEDKSYQLKTMLIEMQSFASDHVAVSTPPKNIPFLQPQVQTWRAPMVPWVNPVGRDLGKPVLNLGNTDMR